MCLCTPSKPRCASHPPWPSHRCEPRELRPTPPPPAESSHRQGSRFPLQLLLTCCLAGPCNVLLGHDLAEELGGKVTASIGNGSGEAVRPFSGGDSRPARPAEGKGAWRQCRSEQRSDRDVDWDGLPGTRLLSMSTMVLTIFRLDSRIRSRDCNKQAGSMQVASARAPAVRARSIDRAAQKGRHHSPAVPWSQPRPSGWRTCGSAGTCPTEAWPPPAP